MRAKGTRSEVPCYLKTESALAQWSEEAERSPGIAYRGFDPLRLFQNPATRAWLVEGELYNGRVAKLAAAGILMVEAVGQGPWWSAPFRVRPPPPRHESELL